MKLINETDVKNMINNGEISPKGTINADDSCIFTPSAIEYLNDKSIRIVQGKKVERQTKPEYKTNLNATTLVNKDHPIIKYRGALDYLESEIIFTQIIAQGDGCMSIITDLEESIKLIRKLIRVEITGEPLGEFRLLGLDAAELREHSHHTTKHYGISHFLPSYTQGKIPAMLNRLRTITRKTELVAYNAFKTNDGSVTRNDICQALNRLSSVFWIMMCKYIKGLYK